MGVFGRGQESARQTCDLRFTNGALRLLRDVSELYLSDIVWARRGLLMMVQHRVAPVASPSAPLLVAASALEAVFRLDDVVRYVKTFL